MTNWNSSYSQNTMAFSEYIIIHTAPIICTVLISGGSYCSFLLLHYSSYNYTYCLKKMWIKQLIIITVLLFILHVKTYSKWNWKSFCCFRTISSHFFANYMNIFHKTEVQTVILRYLTGLINWLKSYNTKWKHFHFFAVMLKKPSIVFFAFLGFFAFCVITFEPIEI